MAPTLRGSANEHCLLLVGYDDENYWFNDPWHDHGVCPQPKQLVEDCHAAQGLFAVTLRPKGEVWKKKNFSRT